MVDEIEKRSQFDHSTGLLHTIMSNNERKYSVIPYQRK